MDITPSQDASASQPEVVFHTDAIIQSVIEVLADKPAIVGREPKGNSKRDSNNNVLGIERARQDFVLSRIHAEKCVAMIDFNSNESDDEQEVARFSFATRELWSSRNYGGFYRGIPLPERCRLESLLDRISVYTAEKCFNLPNFIVAGISSNLKKLGVEDIDCKELIETWLSHRHQRGWTLCLVTPPPPQPAASNNNSCKNSFSCTQCVQEVMDLQGSDQSSSLYLDKSETPTIFSPSQPNSSLLRLTGDGNVKLGQFLTSMEEVRGHLNNATCTLLQASIILTLPYMKLMSGSQLEDFSCETFTREWIELLIMMSQDLASESVKEIDSMLKREYQNLCVESKKLYKTIKKLYKQVSKIFQENDRELKPALQRLQPRRASARERRKNTNTNNNNKPGNNNAAPTNNAEKPKDKNDTATPAPAPSPPNEAALEDLVEQSQSSLLAPVRLSRVNLTSAEMYKYHIFFAKSKKGHLVYKKDPIMQWNRFSELSFCNRRDLFLLAADDLHSTLKLGTSISGRINELFVDGYPESITSSMQENLKYLREASKEPDLLMLSKVTIANQVKGLQESLTRLMKALESVKIVSKCFYKAIKANRSKALKAPKLLVIRKRIAASQLFPVEFTATTVRGKVEVNVNMSIRVDDTKIKLLVPYPNTLPSFGNQFCVSATE